jgi:hypothetical protein
MHVMLTFHLVAVARSVVKNQMVARLYEELKMIKTADDINTLARPVSSTSGVILCNCFLRSAGAVLGSLRNGPSRRLDIIHDTSTHRVRNAGG